MKPVARPRTIMFFLQDLGAGGAERMILALARAHCERGWRTLICVSRFTGELRAQLPPGVMLVDLGCAKVSLAVPALARAVRRYRPHVLVSTLIQANLVACLARAWSPGPRLVLREASNPDLGITVVGGLMRLAYHLLPTVYRRADRILAVSEGVGGALVRRGVPPGLVTSVPNPTLSVQHDRTRAGDPCAHPWFAAGQPPVILAVGRLSQEKNQADLVRAFATLAPTRACRLVLLGSGADRSRLEQLVAALGLNDRVAFAGHVDDTVPYLWRAAVVTLTSQWEGCPNALIEALACDAPVVSYDCDYGPREILADGRFGRLVPVGDVAALAAALAAALDEGRRDDPARRAHLARYAYQRGVRAYQLEILRTLRGRRVALAAAL